MTLDKRKNYEFLHINIDQFNEAPFITPIEPTGVINGASLSAIMKKMWGHVINISALCTVEPCERV